jgi:hypothetical protein
LTSYIFLHVGETILVDAYVQRNGQHLGYTAADIYRKSDNTKIASALHVKAFIESRKMASITEKAKM